MIIVIIIVVSEFSLSIILPGEQEQGYSHSLLDSWLPGLQHDHPQSLIIIRKVRVTSLFQ